MIKRRGYKFRIYPSESQAAQMEEFARSSRFVYNRALRIQIERYEVRKKRIALGDKSIQPEDKHLSAFDIGYLITQWRHTPETSFLESAPFDSLSAVAANLDKAFKRFFKEKNGYPQFKNSRSTVQYTQKANDSVIKKGLRSLQIPKVGSVRARGWDKVDGKIKNLSVRKINGEWYCSLQTELVVPDPIHHGTEIVGIDRGIAKIVALSDGSSPIPEAQIEAYRGSMKDIDHRIRALQRRSRRQVKKDKRTGEEGSNRWKRTQARIAKLYRKAACSRENHTHLLSNSMTNKYCVIAIEDLKVKNMTKSASGTVEKPGKKVKQKSGLNRSILSQAWGELGRQLEYKSQWKGGEVIKVPARYTSQTCSSCGVIDRNSRQSQSSFVCVSCGFTENADLNAAVNIRKLGMDVLQHNYD